MSIMFPEKPRVKILDSMRGIAALTVVLGHLTTTLFNVLPFIKTPLNFFIAAHEAVIFFFLLSGYVLVYQYDKNPGYSYISFLSQRFFRLYVPYLASVILSFIGFCVFAPFNAGPVWLNNTWSKPVTLTLLLKHLLLVSNFDTNALNPVVWSLVHEMRLSILFPFLLLVINLKPLRALLLTFGIVAISLMLILFDKDRSAGYNNSYVMTTYYFFVFVAGGLAAKHRSILIIICNSMSNRRKITLGIFALVIYSYSHYIPAIASRLHIPLASYLGPLSADLPVTAASAIFIVLAISHSAKKALLERPLFLFLGKISYSLYLVHLPLWAVTVYFFWGKIPLFCIPFAGFIICISFAYLFNKYVEKPSLKISRLVKQHFANTAHT